MYAIEFEAEIKNGLVTIPIEYRAIYQSKARVLVLVDEAIKKFEQKKDFRLFFNALRNRHISISPDINIDSLMDEMNNGLC